MSKEINNGGNSARTQTEPENKNKNEKFDYKSPMNEFIEKYTQGNPTYFKNKPKNLIWDEFISFLKGKDTTYDFEDVKKYEEGKTEMYHNTLLSLVYTETVALENLYNGVLKLFGKSYDFTPEEQTKLEVKLNEQDKATLLYLHSGNARRVNFLKKHKIVSRDKADGEEDKVLEKIFGSINFDAIRGNEEIASTISRLERASYNIDISDLNILLDLVGTDELKIAVIKYFVPRISLQEAKKYGFLSDNQIKAYIKSEISGVNLTDVEKEEFVKNANIGDFFIETSNLSNFGDILTNGQLDDLLLKAVIEYKESVLESSTGLSFTGIDDFRDQMLNAGIIPDSSIKAFSNFGVGSYFTTTVGGENGKKEKIDHYYVEEIEENDNGKHFLKIVNITHPNGGINKNNRGSNTIEKVSFEEYFNLLAKIHSSNQTSKINFYSNKDEILTERQITESVYKENFESGDIQTKEELKMVLDEVDKEGSSVSLDKMSFRCQSSSPDSNGNYLVEDEVYQVSKVENGEVHLKGQGAISFSEFALAFKEKKCKRFKRIDNDHDFFNELKAHPNLAEGLKGFKYEHGMIIPDGEHHAEEGVKYFVGPDGDAIMIEKLNHYGANFTRGEYKDGDEEAGKPPEFDGKKGRGRNFDYNELFIYLTSKKFTPIYNKNVHEHEHEHHHHHHSHRGLFKRWFSCMGVAEMVSGSKHVIHAIEHKLKFGNDLKAAKFARFLGKALPEAYQYEIESHVEQEENKSMEAKIKELKGMSTWKMIKEVKHILHTAGPFDPELEAALFAVVGKTGYLYPKGLKSEQGKFLWYQALGGKVGDPIYMKFKKECEDAGRTAFNEEYLVEALLDYQVDVLNLRRNKFNKQYGNVLKEGKKEEEEDGERKTKNKTRAAGRRDYIMGEFKNLTYWNGIGAMENLLKKGPDPGHVFGSIPFVILTTGMSEDFVPEMVNTVFGYSLSVPAFAPLSLITDKNNLKIYNDYVARVIELWKGEDSDMYKDFKGIQGHNKGRAECIDRAEKFWKKYGVELHPKINMSDGFVATRRDDKDNEALKKYYQKIKWVHDNDDFKKDMRREHVEVGFIDQKNTPTAATGGPITKMKLDQEGKFTDTASKKIALMFLDQLFEVTQVEVNSDENSRKKVFKELYTWVERQLSSQISGDDKVKGYKDLPFYQDIVSYGIELFPTKFLHYKDKDHPDSVAYDKELDRKWDEYKKNGYKKFRSDDTEGVVTSTGGSVLDILKTKSR